MAAGDKLHRVSENQLALWTDVFFINRSSIDGIESSHVAERCKQLMGKSDGIDTLNDEWSISLFLLDNEKCTKKDPGFI